MNQDSLDIIKANQERKDWIIKNDLPSLKEIEDALKNSVKIGRYWYKHCAKGVLAMLKSRTEPK